MKKLILAALLVCSAFAQKVDWSQIKNAPTIPVLPTPFAAISSDYAFTAQSPGGTLSTGANTITLTPVPRGVNGSDSNHPVYVSGGTGTAESCLITGGSGTAGQASGQIIINCSNTHSGAWTIQSATAGIQEALQAQVKPYVRIPPGVYSIYGPITPPAAATIEGPSAAYDNLAAPCTLNYIPLTGNLFNVINDHVTVRGLVLYGATSGTATTSNGIYSSGYSGHGTVATLQLDDLYSWGFYHGYYLETLSNVSGLRVRAHANVSHGFVFANVNGHFFDVFSEANGGDALHMQADPGGGNANPNVSGLETFNNQGWGINSTTGLFVSKCYLNFDKAGEVLLDTPFTTQNTLTDCHIEQGGNSPTYGVTATSPGIRVAATSTGYLKIALCQVDSNEGNGIELQNGGNQVIGSWVAANGGGGVNTYQISATGGSNTITSNTGNGPYTFSNAGNVVLGNVITVNSALPGMNFAASAVATTSENNFIQQVGAGTAITTIAGSTFNPPFSNVLYTGAITMGGAVFVPRQFITPNRIATETGSNNAIAGCMTGVPLLAGIEVTQYLSHSLQAGANTYAYCAGAPVSIKRHTTLGDLSVAYPGGSFIRLLYDGTYWEDMSQ